MKYILGIDSGGTKYLVRACTPEGGVVAEYVGPPAPHYRLEREEVIKRVNANIDACLAKFGGSRKECVYLVCGTTGLDTDRDQQAVDDIYKGLSGFVCPVLCVNDAQSLLPAPVPLRSAAMKKGRRHGAAAGLPASSATKDREAGSACAH